MSFFYDPGAGYCGMTSRVARGTAAAALAAWEALRLG